ncbi:MAG: SusE domain-containing protein [Alistipes senegalensis]|nr:SusE domain-containing protein [Bacteroides cellulosilyticus]MCM1351888.1 SusE domain-containing protein [Alistipes senegalensis]
MKKLLNIALFAWAGLALTACEQEHIDAQYNPEKVTAPVAGAVTGAGALALDGPAVTMAYAKADLGFSAAVRYTLYAALDEAMTDRQSVNATFADGVATMTAKDLNTALINAGSEPGTETDVYLQIAVSMLTDKDAVVEGTENLSNIISARFTPYNADVLDVDVYDHVWIIGDYCGWNHGASQFLYDYEKKGAYTGVIDFGEKAANGFKLTGIAGWDDSCNWGTDGSAEAPEKEASSVTLISSGGSSNIAAYSKRFYAFSFDKSTLTLTKQWGADQIGIIGLNGKWGDTDDIVMEYNARKVRFYGDIEATSDTEMKFRADAGWALNWGKDCAQNGDNIAVKAGNYRVYLDLNKNEIVFDEKMYGKPEPTE